MQPEQGLLSSFRLYTCVICDTLMQDAEGSFESTAALTGAERRYCICKDVSKWHVRLKRADGRQYGLQQGEEIDVKQKLVSLFMMHDTEVSFASTADPTGAERRNLICKNC